MNESVLLDTSLRLISKAIDEYIDWHGVTLTRMLYQEKGVVKRSEYKSDVPPAITALRQFLQNTPRIMQGDVDRVFKTVDELHAIVESIVSAGIDLYDRQDKFVEFISMYDALIQRLRRLERDRYLDGRGYDLVSGLRLSTTMYQEMDREMERVMRRGRPFSVTIARLDDIEKLKARVGDRYEDVIRHMGHAILYTTRSFDDSYRLENDEFIMILKQTEVPGAQRFVSRLRDYLKHNPCIIGEMAIPVTASFCVAEPVAGEDMTHFIDLMRKDLDDPAKHSADMIFHYEEESPLRRLARERQSTTQS